MDIIQAFNPSIYFIPWGSSIWTKYLMNLMKKQFWIKTLSIYFPHTSNYWINTTCTNTTIATTSHSYWQSYRQSITTNTWSTSCGSYENINSNEPLTNRSICHSSRSTSCGSYPPHRWWYPSGYGRYVNQHCNQGSVHEASSCFHSSDQNI